MLEIPPMPKAIVKFVAETLVVLGALAGLLQYLGIKPPWVSNAPEPSPMTPAFTQAPHGVGWLIFGLVLFAIALASSTYSLFRSWKVPDQLAIFTPPQLKALTLSKQLGDLIHEIEPPEVVRNTDFPDTPEGVRAFNIALCLKYEKYNANFAKVADRYTREFAYRVKDVVLEFGQEGFNEPELRQFLDSVNTPDDLMRVRIRLICLAYRKDGIKLSMRKPNEA
jgi:hypothetical protein